MAAAAAVGSWVWVTSWAEWVNCGLTSVFRSRSKWPIRPAGEIYNAKPPKIPGVQDIHNAKLLTSLFRRAFQTGCWLSCFLCFSTKRRF